MLIKNYLLDVDPSLHETLLTASRIQSPGKYTSVCIRLSNWLSVCVCTPWGV